jgi:hypothetical protein
MKSLNRIAVLGGLTALFAIASAAIFLNEDGTGFVGKGDVQLALGLNNKQLQTTPVAFTFETTTVSELEWECTNTRNDKVQEKSRTVTSTTNGLFSSLARVKNQITGFNLNGWDGAVTTTTQNGGGPAVNACPDNSGTWILTSPAGDAVILSQTGGMFVNGVQLQGLR